MPENRYPRGPSTQIEDLYPILSIGKTTVWILYILVLWNIREHFGSAFSRFVRVFPTSTFCPSALCHVNCSFITFQRYGPIFTPWLFCAGSRPTYDPLHPKTRHSSRLLPKQAAGQSSSWKQSLEAVAATAVFGWRPTEIHLLLQQCHDYVPWART